MAPITFQIDLEQPVLIGDVGAGEENSAVTVNYIPGSVIRGMLIHHYIHQHGNLQLAPNKMEYLLFFSGQVQFLNAYLLSTRGERMLPLPRSWQIEKDDENSQNATIHDLASTSEKKLESPISPGASFCTLSDQEVALAQPDLHIGLHNASTKRFVKRQEDSTVFRYDALATGQSFGGVILCPDDTTMQSVIEELLAAGNFHIGRSRRAGYGRVQISNIKTDSAWQEYQTLGKQNILPLTLLSNTILRDRLGQWTTDITAALDLPAPTKSFLATTVTGGFNRTWGLPLPQSPTLCAGSVYVFAADDELAKTLTTLAATGIGERRIDGFGRVAVNWHGAAMLNRRDQTSQRPLRAEAVLQGQSRTLAQMMVERLYRHALDDLLRNRVAALSIERAPENSQLSRLRVIVRRAWREANPKLVDDHLQKLKSTARQQYQRARIDGHSFAEWLAGGWQNNQIWQAYFLVQPAELPRIGDVGVEESDAIKREYIVRLIDALCQKAMKERALEGVGQ